MVTALTHPKVKPRWILKGCPTCIKGDLFREDDHYTCLQCGFIIYDRKPLSYRRFDPVMLERRLTNGTGKEQPDR